MNSKLNILHMFFPVLFREKVYQQYKGICRSPKNALNSRLKLNFFKTFLNDSIH